MSEWKEVLGRPSTKTPKPDPDLADTPPCLSAERFDVVFYLGTRINWNTRLNYKAG